jgi:hypothetical protein
VAPLGSPAWVNDPQRLWAAAEEAERRRNSTVCRDFTVALPYEAALMDLIASKLYGQVRGKAVRFLTEEHARPVSGTAVTWVCLVRLGMRHH